MNYKENLKNLSPYKPGKSIENIKKEYNIDNVIKLASNENPYGTSPKALKVFDNPTSLELYPDNYCTLLRDELSKKLNINKENLIFGNGSVEIIQMLCRTFLSRNDEVITCTPSFSSYWSETILQEAKIIEVPLKDYVFDLKGILEKITNKTRIIFITNPNNPTGTIVNKLSLTDFLNKVPKDILVILDEAYYEFVKNKDEYPESVEFLKNFSNICILRTFSKAYGLASIRIGYGITTPEIINELEKSRVPFNINTVAQKAATNALLDTDFINYSYTKNKEVLEYLYKELDKLNIFYIKSEANFIMIDTKQNSNEAFEKLLHYGFIVRPGFPNMDTFIRVSIGTFEQMKLFIDALKEILK